MTRPIALLLCAIAPMMVLSGCPENVPDAECVWRFPDAEGARLSSTGGFNLQISVSGEFEAEELVVTRFFSDIEASGSDYPDGLLLEAGIVREDAGCAEGCLSGGRLETPIAPGTHRVTAKVLTPTAAEACSIERTIVVNTPPTLSGITFSPEAPVTGDDVSFIADVSDADGDSVTVSNTWTGPAGQELNSDLLTSIQTSAGKTWTLTVTPRDDLESGESMSADVTIVNTPPEAPTVAITPVPARLNAPITCAVLDLDDLDPDPGQSLAVSWSWTRDGNDAGVSGDTVTGAQTAADETWACTAVVSDGTDSSEGGTAETTVLDALSVGGTTDLGVTGIITGVRGDQYTGDAGAIGSPGDINGDGMAELLLAVNDEVCTTFCDGQSHAYLFLGGTGALSGDLDDADVDFQAPEGVRIGAPDRVGDLDGDGLLDMVLPYRDAVQPLNPTGNGVYIVFGSEDGWDSVVDLELDAVKVVNASGEEIGQSPCPVGDLDGDGFDDLALSAPFANLGAGKLYVVYGHPGAWLSGLDVGSLLPSFVVEGAIQGQTMGQSCAGPIDIDGNGLTDLVVSAPGGGPEELGRVLVYLSDGDRNSGTLSSATADVLIDANVGGFGGFGTALTSLGDHNGDGFGDFAIHSQGPEDPDDPGDAGNLWIALGGDAGFVGAIVADDLPVHISGAGTLGFCGHPAGVDVDGDGLGDLACGDVRPQTAADLDTPVPSAVRVFLGGLTAPPAERSFSDADIKLEAEDDDDLVGVSVRGLWDRDGDGYNELLIGAPGRDGPLTDSGACYVVDFAN